MSKYTPLTGFLATQAMREVPMTFAQIEAVIGCPLPASKQHPAWWSNNASNNVMTRAWLAAGFRSERIDVAGERVVFRRATGIGPSSNDMEADFAPVRPGGFFANIREALGGTVRVAEGVDLTEPLDVVWNAQVE